MSKEEKNVVDETKDGVQTPDTKQDKKPVAFVKKQFKEHPIRSTLFCVGGALTLIAGGCAIAHHKGKVEGIEVGLRAAGLNEIPVPALPAAAPVAPALPDVETPATELDLGEVTTPDLSDL